MQQKLLQLKINNNKGQTHLQIDMQQEQEEGDSSRGSCTGSGRSTHGASICTSGCGAIIAGWSWAALLALWPSCWPQQRSLASTCEWASWKDNWIFLRMTLGIRTIIHRFSILHRPPYPPKLNLAHHEFFLHSLNRIIIWFERRGIQQKTFFFCCKFLQEIYEHHQMWGCAQNVLFHHKSAAFFNKASIESVYLNNSVHRKDRNISTQQYFCTNYIIHIHYYKYIYACQHVGVWQDRCGHDMHRIN